MTSNGNDEVIHSENQRIRAVNGFSQMKGGDSMHGFSTPRKIAPINHNMGLKRTRSVDIAGIY